VCYRGPVFLADFEIIPIEAVRGQIYGGMGAGVRGQSPLLDEGIFRSVRLGRLGIGMISKSAKKDGASIVYQCPSFNGGLLTSSKMTLLKPIKLIEK